MNRSSSSSRFRPAKLGAAVAAVLFGALVTASACGGGSIGFECRFNDECGDGFCCGSSECAGGMCTYACNSDLDCPDDMGCDHGVCFFRCNSNAECPLPFNCVHGHSLCEA